jgi:hypothetical protein
VAISSTSRIFALFALSLSRIFACAFYNHLLREKVVRRSHVIFGILLWLVILPVRADNFQLSNGETLVGEVLGSSANDAGVQVKIGEGEYKRVPWASFSQEDLKKFAQNKKMEPFVEPFIEISPEEKAKKTEVAIKQPQRIERAEKHSLIGAFFGSGLGILILVVLYAANIYAGYEIALFRAQPVPLVCGVSAVAPVIGPIVFLSMPTRMQPAEATWETGPPPQAEPAPIAATEAINPMQGAQTAAPAGLKIAHAETQETAATVEAPAFPPSTTFQRGQFTFNRRFFETKFPGFFGVVKRDADKDMVLVIKASRGRFIGQRISRIAANDLHLEVQKGAASEEVMIPFIEIQDIQLKHKDAP